MTSIPSSTFQHFTSPRELLQSTLDSKISTGAINAVDGGALSDALDDIDASIQSERASGAAAGGGRPSPDAMKQKIDDLITAEVKNGKLTEDQAGELKDVFASAFQRGGPGGAGGPGGPGGPHGPGAPGGPGGGGAALGSDDATQDSSASDTDQLLQDFIKLLQDAQGSTGYNAAGDLQSKLKSLLIDYQS
jgi:hypothetical protein